MSRVALAAAMCCAFMTGVLVHETSRSRTIHGTADGRRVSYSLNPGGDTIAIKATVDGIEGTFIVDTGAGATSVTASFAKRLNLALDEESTKYATANGYVWEHSAARTSTVDLGGLKASGIRLTVLSNASSLYDGLLGMDFLRCFKVELTDAKLILSSPGIVLPRADWERRSSLVPSSSDGKAG